MDENFKKFKRRVWLEILIKCIVCGLAAAFIAVNAVLVPCKLFGIKLLWLFYILIALGGFAVGGGIAFVILRTNDKKIAKRLDSELKLEERVQTAYMYSGHSGAMLDLQRGNASAELGKLSVKALPFKNVAATVLCGVVALTGVIAAPIAAKFVPPVYAANNTDEPPEEPKRPVTDWEWAALDELINYVRASKKADTVTKTGMLLELEGLRGVLADGVSQSSLSTFVQNTVSNIRNVVKDANGRDISEEQKTLNSEEEAYVINKLYEIFSLQKPDGEGDGDDSDPSGGEEDPDNPDEPGGDSGWELDVNDVPFYDPDKGYVKVGEIREEYYQRVQAAFEEGTISREEWEYIIVTYFADLSNKE